MTESVNDNAAAIIELNGNITPQTINVTAQGGTTLLTNASFKMGKLVSIGFKLGSVTCASGTSLTAALLPEGVRPSEETNVIVNINGDICGVGWIRTNGEIAIAPFQAISNIQVRLLGVYHV